MGACEIDTAVEGSFVIREESLREGFGARISCVREFEDDVE
jgi:hypothetical protein